MVGRVKETMGSEELGLTQGMGKSNAGEKRGWKRAGERQGFISVRISCL